jgi:predicted XRE-type DNA-binding protein
VNEAKRKRLAAAGYQSTSVADFLGLSTEQNELIEIKVALTVALKKQRSVRDMSQSQLAEKIGSSQSRVAKMEAGDPHVSFDLILRALIALGMTRSEIAEVMSPVSLSALRPQIS